ncbi:MAG: tetratricopeptide repeat protein [Betaproteobacteria bacterium]|nr:tetratricopeptide repeat protein [Betaproteobacteria bacterium]
MSKRFLIAVIFLAFNFANYSFADIPKLNKLIEDKDYLEAKKIVDQLIDSDNDNPQLLFINGVLLSELGQIDDAINVFVSLTKSHPALPEPYNNLAVLYAQNGDFDLAKIALEKSIKTHPSYATAHINLGDLYTRMASESYNQALQIDKSNKNAKTKLSLIKKLFNFQPINKNIALTEDISQKPKSFQEIKDIEVSVNEKILVMIDNWKNAWMNQNFDQYIGYYSTNFKNNKGMDLEQWKQFRKPRVINKPSIKLKLENIEISKNNNLFSVSFTQIYQSGSIDSTTKKTLLIELVDNQLKIVNEIS